ncbi:MAG: ATP-dependent helicase/nuclease subunit B [Flavobacteriales bacterium]|jgi:ATP-dependent helicase/nuclease subunit B
MSAAITPCSAQDFLNSLKQKSVITATNRVIITANQRQARFLQKKALSANKNHSFNSLRILPLSAWLSESWLNLQDAALDGTSSIWIDPFAEQQLISQIIAEDSEVPPLIDQKTLVDNLYKAIQIIDDYGMDENEISRFASPESLFLLRVKRRFKKDMEARSLIGAGAFQTKLREKLDWREELKEDSIVLYGFVELSPRLSEIFSLISTTVSITEHSEADTQLTQATQQTRHFDSSDSEITAAVMWAKTNLGDDENAQIAIIAPNLTQIKSSLERELQKTLDPNRYLDSNLSNISKHYDISAGQNLNELALIESVFRLLTLNSPRITRDNLKRLISDQYWGESLSRNYALRSIEYFPMEEMSLGHFLERCITKECLKDGERNDLSTLLKVRATLNTFKKIQLDLCGWNEKLITLLEDINWPGPSQLNTLLYQQFQFFLGGLQNLSSFDAAIDKKYTFSDYTSLLHHYCSSLVFHPQNIGVRLEVMGLLEASGLEFDACWILGLAEGQFPTAPKSNPFLPFSLQLKHSTPRSSAIREFNYAESLLGSVVNMNPNVTFSWANESVDINTRLTPIITQTENNGIECKVTESNWNQYVQSSKKISEFIEVTPGPAPEILEGEKISGGAGHFNLALVNPLYSFFRYRLKIQERESIGLSYTRLEEGIILHSILAELYIDTNSRDALQTYMDDNDHHSDLRSRIAKCILAFTRPQHHFSEIVIDELTQRLFFAITKFLELELTRDQNFTVQSLEFESEVVFSKRSLNLRIDRLDNIDGNLVLMDYKSGSTSINPALKNQIKHAQLPLYSLLYEPNKLQAVTFAEVNYKHQAYTGIGSESIQLKGVYPDIKIRSPEVSLDWIDITDHWRTSINALADGIIYGHVDYSVKDKSAAAFYNGYERAVRPEEREL